MEDRNTQFDIWRDNAKTLLQEPSLIVTDKDFKIGKKISQYFKSIQFVKDIEIKLGNKLIRKYQIFWELTYS